jgi:hypothetical protein
MHRICSGMLETSAASRKSRQIPETVSSCLLAFNRLPDTFFEDETLLLSAPLE